MCITTPQLFACLRYTDADSAIEFLTAIGFTERLVVRDADDPAILVHAQFRLGTGITNLVVESAVAVDRVLRPRGRRGRSIDSEPSEPPHGGRFASVLDFDGNHWGIDFYTGVTGTALFRHGARSGRRDPDR